MDLILILQYLHQFNQIVRRMIMKRITNKRFRHYMKHGTFTEYVDSESKKDPKNIFSPPTDPQLAVYFLRDYLLGEDWYTPDPISTNQANTEIVHEILMKYSRRYRKECKLYEKKHKKF